MLCLGHNVLHLSLYQSTHDFPCRSKYPLHGPKINDLRSSSSFSRQNRQIRPHRLLHQRAEHHHRGDRRVPDAASQAAEEGADREDQPDEVEDHEVARRHVGEETDGEGEGLLVVDGLVALEPVLGLHLERCPQRESRAVFTEIALALRLRFDLQQLRQDARSRRICRRTDSSQSGLTLRRNEGRVRQIPR